MKFTSELRDATCQMGSHSVICYPTEVAAPPSAYWSRYPNLSLEWLLAADYSYTGSMDISSVLRSSQCYVMCRTLHLLVLKSICHFWDQVVSLDKRPEVNHHLLQSYKGCEPVDWSCCSFAVFRHQSWKPVLKRMWEQYLSKRCLSPQLPHTLVDHSRN